MIRVAVAGAAGRMGQTVCAAVEAQDDLVENVRWSESRVVFATLHVVGSNNGLAPWTAQTAPTTSR